MIFNVYARESEKVNGINLVSCGHIFAKPGREIYRPKGREDWLLFFVAKESETFYLNEEILADEGSFILFSPGEKQHHKYTGNKTAEFYYIHFKCDKLPDNINLKTRKQYKVNQIRHICDIFEEIIEEIMQKNYGFEKICIYKLLYILTVIERNNNENKAGENERFHRIAKVLQHMNRYYDSDCSLEDYAEISNMSKYHFLRVFEQITGFSPLNYRNNIRLEHAAELLCEEKMSVEEVSSATGFSSLSYFSSTFKKKYGVSPKKYQKENFQNFS